VFLSGKPLAILILRAIVVSPVNRCSREPSWPHIPEESREGVYPFLAYGNPSTTVAFESIVLGIRTTCLQIGPASVGGMFTAGDCYSFSFGFFGKVLGIHPPGRTESNFITPDFRYAE
jgi:hypothetical protein